MIPVAYAYRKVPDTNARVAVVVFEGAAGYVSRLVGLTGIASYELSVLLPVADWTTWANMKSGLFDQLYTINMKKFYPLIEAAEHPMMSLEEISRIVTVTPSRRNQGKVLHGKKQES